MAGPLGLSPEPMAHRRGTSPSKRCELQGSWSAAGDRHLDCRLGRPRPSEAPSPPPRLPCEPLLTTDTHCLPRWPTLLVVVMVGVGRGSEDELKCLWLSELRSRGQGPSIKTICQRLQHGHNTTVPNRCCQPKFVMYACSGRHLTSCRAKNGPCEAKWCVWWRLEQVTPQSFHLVTQRRRLPRTRPSPVCASLRHFSPLVRLLL